MNTDDKEKSLLCFDEGFPDRVLRTSFYLSLIIIAYSLSYMSVMLTVSVSIGCFISLAVYKALWWAIQHGVRNKRAEIKGFFLKISLVKYGVVGVMLFVACLLLDINVTALAIGLGIVLAVIVMKVGSRILVHYLNRTVRAQSSRS